MDDLEKKREDNNELTKQNILKYTAVIVMFLPQGHWIVFHQERVVDKIIYYVNINNNRACRK